MRIDAHCDVLSKLYEMPSESFVDSSKLDVTLKRLKASQMLMQCFAIYMPGSIQHSSIEHVLQFIRLFHEKILIFPEMRFVKFAQDLDKLIPGRKIGAMLTLEGADALDRDPAYVRLLFELGVRCLGITWNYANWAADGVLEPRQAGLTLRGMELIDECSRVGMIIDISHLAETGFWQTLERAAAPIIASHSNAYAVYRHPRNLKDAQILALIQRQGMIGITFVPYFVAEQGKASIDSLIKHIDHIAALGGISNVMLGSDFDGIEEWIPGLEHPGMLDNLQNEMYKHYASNIVEGIMYKNAYRFFKKVLPQS